MSFRIGEEHVFLGKEMRSRADFSEETAHTIDEEVQKLCASRRAGLSPPGTQRDKLDNLVEALLQKEELLKEEFDSLLAKTDQGRHHRQSPDAHRRRPGAGPAHHRRAGHADGPPLDGASVDRDPGGESLPCPYRVFGLTGWVDPEAVEAGCPCNRPPARPPAEKDRGAARSIRMVLT